MTKQWLIIETSWLWPVVIAVGFMVALVIREWLGNNSHKLLNISLYFVATLSLLLIWLEPQWRQNNKSAGVILLTSGYDSQQLDSLKKVSKAQVIDYDSVPHHKVKSALKSNNAYLIGDGLMVGDIPLWDSAGISYLKNPKQLEGVSKLHFRSKYKVGETLTIQGVVNRKKDIMLKLKGFGSTLDSLKVEHDHRAFKLQTNLKAAGRFVLELVEQDSSDHTLTQSEIPIVVEEPQRLKVLFINSFPTFELKYLKNFLVSEGHELTVRNQLSRSKYRYEYYNTDPQRFYRLNDDFLSPFDLLITNHYTLNELSSAGTESLKSQIEEGLGLFVIPDKDMFVKAHELINFDFEPTSAERVVLPIDDEAKEVKSHPYRIKTRFGEAEVFNNAAAYKRYGLGRVATTTLIHTYELVLNGEETFYQKLWKQYLEAVTQNKANTSLHGNWLARVNYPFHFELSGLSERPEISVRGVKIPMLQDPHLPTRWQGSYWPKSAGWHVMQLENHKDSLWFYVQNDTSWQALNRAKRRVANQQAFSGNKETQGKQVIAYARIDPIWFYLAFLISVGYLWLAPKLR